MSGNGGVPGFATNVSLLSETNFYTPVTLEALLGFLRDQRITGQLVIHLHQGGVQRVSLMEKSALDIAT
jgi:hypothetical protein